MSTPQLHFLGKAHTWTKATTFMEMVREVNKGKTLAKLALNLISTPINEGKLNQSPFDSETI